MAVVRGQLVSEPGDSTIDVVADKLRALHVARVKAELAAADALAPGQRPRPAARGAAWLEIAVVKGLPGPAEASGGTAMSGADGTALLKALEALGYACRHGVLHALASRAGHGPRTRAPTGCASSSSRSTRTSSSRSTPRRPPTSPRRSAASFRRPGVAQRVLGRRIVAVSGFEAALGDPKAKQRVWAELKAAKPEGPVY